MTVKEIIEKYDPNKVHIADNWIPLQDWWDDIQVLISRVRDLEEGIRKMVSPHFEKGDNYYKRQDALKKLIEKEG
jgi:hypothetical protein